LLSYLVFKLYYIRVFIRIFWNGVSCILFRIEYLYILFVMEYLCIRFRIEYVYILFRMEYLYILFGMEYAYIRQYLDHT
jgi:hypothetical protein